MTLATESRQIMSGVYIGYPNDGFFCGASSAQKKKTTFLKIEHNLPYIFSGLMLLTHHSISSILYLRSGDYFIDTFSKETWLAVGMNGTSSTPKGTKC